jgi:hypothetical protein
MANERKKTQAEMRKALHTFCAQQGLDPDKAMLVAGGAAYMHGHRDDVNDIDFFHPDLKDFVKGQVGRFEMDAGPGTNLSPAATKHTAIGGMHVQTPEAMLAFYQHLNRPKDQPKILFLKEITKKASGMLHPAMISAFFGELEKQAMARIDMEAAGHAALRAVMRDAKIPTQNVHSLVRDLAEVFSSVGGKDKYLGRGGFHLPIHASGKPGAPRIGALTISPYGEEAAKALPHERHYVSTFLGKRPDQTLMVPRDPHINTSQLSASEVASLHKQVHALFDKHKNQAQRAALPAGRPIYK